VIRETDEMRNKIKCGCCNVAVFNWDAHLRTKKHKEALKKASRKR